MSRMKLIVLGLLAAFALSAIAASTASAVTHEWKVEGTTIAKGSKVEAAGQVTSGTLEFEVGSTSIEIKCDYPGLLSAGSTNYLEAEGKNHLKIESFGCTVRKIEKGKPVNLPECKVKEGKTAVEATGELEQARPGVNKFTSVSGSLAIEKNTNACGVEGTVNYEGKLTCGLPWFGFEIFQWKFWCTPWGSHPFLIGGKPARIWWIIQLQLLKGQKIGQT
jgi:hypothetical protein